MTFKEIYERIAPLWGENISFEDGIVIEPKKTYKKPGILAPPKEHFYSKQLSVKWGSVEEQVSDEDNFGKLMIWCMYQLFHKHAIHLYEKNTFAFKVTDVSKQDIEEHFYKTLVDEEREEELAVYKRDI